MAFLQRVINGGGRIDREYATGRGRIDLCVHWQDYRYVLELKVRRSEKTYEQGKEQLKRYLDRTGERTGWLLVFDQRQDVSWDDKLFWREEAKEDVTIHTAGL